MHDEGCGVRNSWREWGGRRWQVRGILFLIIFEQKNSIPTTEKGNLPESVLLVVLLKLWEGVEGGVGFAIHKEGQQVS